MAIMSPRGALVKRYLLHLRKEIDSDVLQLQPMNHPLRSWLLDRQGQATSDYDVEWEGVGASV